MFKPKKVCSEQMFSTAEDVTCDYSENSRIICFKRFFLFSKSKFLRFNKIHYTKICINLINKY